MDLIGEDVRQCGELIGGRFAADVDVEGDAGRPEAAVATHGVGHRRHPRERSQRVIDSVGGPRAGEIAAGDQGCDAEHQNAKRAAALAEHSHGVEYGVSVRLGALVGRHQYC
ncbi:Uncharacterised protein [Mycobacteroides abscessus subsp. massiliense]|nr:Uncharacterised protein [Mycobacteroides abscessus subsp. massiliense]